MLSTLFCALCVMPDTGQVWDQQPTLIVIQNTMSLYKTISEKYYQNTEIIEVTFLKYISDLYLLFGVFLGFV